MKGSDEWKINVQIAKQKDDQKELLKSITDGVGPSVKFSFTTISLHICYTNSKINTEVS